MLVAWQDSEKTDHEDLLVAHPLAFRYGRLVLQGRQQQPSFMQPCLRIVRYAQAIAQR